jgi:hypothetical protein
MLLCPVERAIGVLEDDCSVIVAAQPGKSDTDSDLANLRKLLVLYGLPEAIEDRTCLLKFSGFQQQYKFFAAKAKQLIL